MSDKSALSGYSVLPEPELLFGDHKKYRHPLTGLIASGPYGLRLNAPSRVRLAVLAPRNEMARLRGLVQELERTIKPIEAKNYYPVYEGFAKVFRTPLIAPDASLTIELPGDLDAYAARGDKVALGFRKKRIVASLEGGKGCDFATFRFCSLTDLRDEHPRCMTYPPSALENARTTQVNEQAPEATRQSNVPHPPRRRILWPALRLLSAPSSRCW